MTYDQIAAVTQTTSLLLFISLFIIVLAYVFWPKNRDRLERAQREALDLGSDKTTTGGRS